MSIVRVVATGLAALSLTGPQLSTEPAPALSIGELIAAARGASPILCALAAQSIGNGYGGWQPPYPIVAASYAPVRQALREASLESSLPLLLPALDDPDPCVREVGARLLGRQRSTTATTAIASRLASSDGPGRAAAAYALGLTGAGVSAPLEEALADPVPAVRGNALWALGRIGDGAAAGRVWRLLRDGEAPVRAAAVQTLRHLEARDSVELIIQVLRSDPDAEVRRVAAWALADLGARASAPALIEALRRDEDGSVREMAAWALSEVRSPEATEALHVALREDDNEEVRATAIWALGSQGDENALPRIVEALGDPSAEIRARAAWAIGSIEPSAAPPALVRALRDDDVDVRLRAAWALGQIADASVLPALSAALDVETNSEVREAELRALLMMGQRDEEALARLIETGTPEIRSQAVAALAGRSLRPWPWPWPWPQPRPFP
jgi:HEAT repeat protein